MLEKFFKTVVCFCMILVSIHVSNVDAVSESEIIDNELKYSIISGDGTAENPFVVDYDKAPHFKEYMDKINEKVMLSLQGMQSQEIIPKGIYDGILCGTKHANQTLGGSWAYKSNAPDTTYNGNIWMIAVTYTSIKDTEQNYKTLSNEYYWNKIDAIGQEICTRSYSDAYNLLISTGIGGSAATALLRALGKVNSVFSAVTMLSFLNDYLELNKFKDAVNKKDGMIFAQYYTSYQGQWYSHQGEDSWTTADDVYEPASYYGTGNYYANK